LILLSIITIGIIAFVACTKDESTTNGETKPNNITQRTAESNELAFDITENIYNLKYFATLNDSIVESTLTVTVNDKELFETNYIFDTKELHWKLKQSQLIISKGNELKAKSIPIEKLQDIINILTNNYDTIFSDAINKKDILLISSLNYHKSIINSSIRAKSNNEDCNCTVHPAFLVDKTFFNCQEEHFLNVSELKNYLTNYINQNSNVDSSTLNLMAFLNNYQENEIRFDEFYNFYIEKQTFINFITETLNSGKRNCGWWCPMGCGSSIGCCSNYSGCCLYSDIICGVHDVLCLNCKPRWFCGPKCVPE
jgi:hypothetical protein